MAVSAAEPRLVTTCAAAPQTEVLARVASGAPSRLERTFGTRARRRDTVSTTTNATVTIRVAVMLKHLDLDVVSRTAGRPRVASCLVAEDIRIAYSMCLKLNGLMFAHLFDVVDA